MARLGEANRAARLLGLKMFLLSASLAAVGAAMPSAVSDQSLADATWGGMKLLHIILGTMGAGASLFFLPQFNGKALGATVTCGIACAVVGTPALSWIYTEHWSATKAALPVPVDNLLAMALGVAGVYIIPAFQGLSAAFKRNPLGFVDWLRGRGAAPGQAPPPEPAPTQPQDSGGGRP